MKIFFLRHGETPASSQGIIQGRSDDVLFNNLTTKGVEQVENSAEKIADLISCEDPNKVFLYTTPFKRTLQSSQIIRKKINIPEKNFSIDSRISPRDYGKLEGYVEKELRETTDLILKATKGLAYVMSELGIKRNGQNIETKQHFESRILNFFWDLYSNHAQDDTVIISANSDMWNVTRKNDNALSFLCEFTSKAKLNCGEFTVMDFLTGQSNLLNNCEMELS